PRQELAGFAKVHLEAGASETVTVALDRRSFAVWDVVAHDWLVESGEHRVIVARSTVEHVEEVTVGIDSDDVLAPRVVPADLVATDDEFTAMLGRPIPVPRPA